MRVYKASRFVLASCRISLASLGDGGVKEPKVRDAAIENSEQLVLQFLLKNLLILHIQLLNKKQQRSESNRAVFAPIPCLSSTQIILGLYHPV